MVPYFGLGKHLLRPPQGFGVAYLLGSVLELLNILAELFVLLDLPADGIDESSDETLIVDGTEAGAGEMSDKVIFIQSGGRSAQQTG